MSCDCEQRRQLHAMDAAERSDSAITFERIGRNVRSIVL